MKSNRPIASQIPLYLWKFAQKAQLVPPSKRVVAAISGGMDSMFLLWLLGQWKKRGWIKEVLCVHVNHGTRSQADKEAKLVAKESKRWGLQCVLENLNLSLEVSDFEHKARTERYKILRSYLKQGDFLYLAHHLDDSFEWHLLQKFKSSQEVLGIPVRNGAIARPFMALSKAQIARAVSELELSFYHDQSNEMQRFERNYLRANVTKNLGERFPAHLKHYVTWANKRAFEKGVSAFGASQVHAVKKLSLAEGIILFEHTKLQRNFKGLENAITQAVHELSGVQRGSLSTQVGKIIEALELGRKGPLKLSGGVQAHLYQGQLLLLSAKGLRQVKQWDLQTLELLRDTSQIPRVKFNELHAKAKLFAFSPKREDLDKICPSLKALDPLFQQSTQFALGQGWWFQGMGRFLYCWKKQRDCSQSLPLLLSVGKARPY